MRLVLRRVHVHIFNLFYVLAPYCGSCGSLLSTLLWSYLTKVWLWVFCSSHEHYLLLTGLPGKAYGGRSCVKIKCEYSLTCMES